MKLNWVEYMLEHISADAECLCGYIWKSPDVPFTLASKSLGYHLVQGMNKIAAEAMWADENINATQQCTVKRHLWYYFGKQILRVKLLLCSYLL
jgi:hypothetical protein